MPDKHRIRVYGQDWALEITEEVALRRVNKPETLKFYICNGNEKLSNSSMCVVTNL